ncbi:MAG: cytochrome c oxidase subunit 3 [Acidimicrobiales bacterium]
MSLVEQVSLSRSSGFDPGRTRPLAFWGMATAITTEAMLFAGLLSSYFYLQATSEEWPLGGLPHPQLGVVSVFSAVLLGSSAPVWWAERAIARDDVAGLRAGLAVAWVMGAAFLTFTVYEWSTAEFSVSANAYASVFHSTVGLHALHLTVGLALGVGVQAKAWTGRLSAARHATVTLFAMYWHFVDAVWVAVFTSLYLSPRWT